MPPKGSREVRVRPKETVLVDGTNVTNRTGNSILVRSTARGLVVADCCLEEQGK
jgi:hypothetical protein